MKRVVASKSYEYNGTRIYWDSDSGQWYIYTDSHGKSRINFSTDKDAEEWLDEDEVEPLPLSTYFVYYVNRRYDKLMCISVESRTKQEAIRKAKQRLGRDFDRLDRVAKDHWYGGESYD